MTCSAFDGRIIKTDNKKLVSPTTLFFKGEFLKRLFNNNNIRSKKSSLLTRAPSGPNICKKFPMNSLDFSSHFWMRSMLFSSTFWTNSLLFSSTSRTFLFTLSTRSCRWYFFSWCEDSNEDRLLKGQSCCCPSVMNKICGLLIRFSV